MGPREFVMAARNIFARQQNRAPHAYQVSFSPVHELLQLPGAVRMRKHDRLVRPANPRVVAMLRPSTWQ
jgi:hypothetical protein